MRPPLAMPLDRRDGQPPRHLAPHVPALEAPAVSLSDFIPNVRGVTPVPYRVFPQPVAHGGLYGSSGMYCAHSARVMGSPVREHTYAAAAAGLAIHNRVVSSWLPAARVVPSGLKATENTVPAGPVSDPI